MLSANEDWIHSGRQQIISSCGTSKESITFLIPSEAADSFSFTHLLSGRHWERELVLHGSTLPNMEIQCHIITQGTNRGPLHVAYNTHMNLETDQDIYSGLPLIHW